ncbi:MAG TPA: glycosyltransferase family 9 protein [Acidobacteriaceae bacterium]|jgi:ADP-heptose:LPS heptosyltransferase|nr:glycosyltransferase family 9 protein [Acidobacteriaceae bacterium]
MSSSIQRVLIYRLGSLGDTVVALPCFHQIARAFPNAQRSLLTNVPVHSKAPAAFSVLEGSGLVDGYLRYPIGMRHPSELLALRREIRQWRPQILIYLTVRKRWQDVARDVAFFRFCGIAKIIGAPFSHDARTHRLDASSGLYEAESSRLARSIHALGSIHLQDAANWDLRLTPKEHTRAAEALLPLGNRPLLACSVGTKVQAKDWGGDNWHAVLQVLAQKLPNHGLVLLGAPEERAVSDAAAMDWQGRMLNLCGSLTPRESAAVLARAQLFLGHDSGPMHLAAAVQTRCIAVFAARNRPVVWFPCGTSHEILYHRTDCWGCGLETCIEQRKKCLTAITPAAVLAVTQRVLGW